MSDKIKIPLADAVAVALPLLSQLAPHCKRIALAGSIRRGQEMVSDIEIVAQPRYYKRLRHPDAEAVSALDIVCEKLLMHAHMVTKRLNKRGHAIAWGSRFKAMIYQDIPVDLFIVLNDRQWGPTMLIRTGPRDANTVLVTHKGVRNHLNLMGVLPHKMQFSDGAVIDHGQTLDTPEEEDVFAALNMPWVPPHLRLPSLYITLAVRADWLLENWRYKRAYLGRIPPCQDALYWDGKPHKLVFLDSRKEAGKLEMAEPQLEIEL